MVDLLYLAVRSVFFLSRSCLLSNFDFEWSVDIAGAVLGILAALIGTLVTLKKTWSQVKMASALGIPVNVSSTLLRDGKQLSQCIRCVTDVLSLQGAFSSGMAMHDHIHFISLVFYSSSLLLVDVVNTVNSTVSTSRLRCSIGWWLVLLSFTLSRTHRLHTRIHWTQ